MTAPVVVDAVDPTLLREAPTRFRGLGRPVQWDIDPRAAIGTYCVKGKRCRCLGLDLNRRPLTAKLELEGSFLIYWDMVQLTRRNGVRILCQGRGSAANSAVCYSLGITAFDPVGMDLLFKRFFSGERSEWPDIDFDPPRATSASGGSSTSTSATRSAGRE